MTPEGDAAAITDRLRRRFGAHDIVPLAPDASVRNFYRLTFDDATTAVALVDQVGGAAALARMRAAGSLLRDIGVRVPELRDADDDLPALLFEDLGDVLLVDALPQLTDEEQAQLYATAGRTAARIALDGTSRVTPEHPLATPQLGVDRLTLELDFFTQHDVRGRRGIDDAALLADLAAWRTQVVACATRADLELAHRDFHARNLMLLPDLTLGVVDFQDALLAPRHYDLASLICDPYVAPADALAQSAIDAYSDEGGLARDPRDEPGYAWVALQRDLKAIGTYAYQSTVLGRTRFLGAIPVAERLCRLSVRHLPHEERHVAQRILDGLGFEPAG